MQRLLQGLARPRTFLPLLVLVLVGYAVSAQLIPQNTLAIIINGLLIAVSVMVMAAYGPGFITALRSSELKKDQYLLSGILLLWLSLAASRMWSLALIMAGKPPWMINHWFQTFCYLVAASSGFYFLQITGHSKTGIRYVTAAIVIAVMIITVVLAFFEY